jgi:hypothetical protein
MRIFGYFPKPALKCSKLHYIIYIVDVVSMDFSCPMRGSAFSRQPDTSSTEQDGSYGTAYEIFGIFWVRIAAQTPANLTDAMRGFLRILNEKIAVHPNQNTP